MPAWKTEYIAGPPRIAVDHAGSGPLVVLMHGIGGNRTNWHDQLPEFGRSFHAVAWDARGYGNSNDYNGDLNFDDFATDLARVLEHFGASRAHLVGLSMGGVIALDFVARWPERVTTLTLCDSLPGFSHLSEEQRREFIRLRQEPLLAGKEPKDIAPTVAKSLLGKSPRPGSFERLVASMAALHKESYLKTIAGMANYSRVFDLEAITAPTHVVVGDEDTLTPPATSRQMARRIAGARLTIIEGSGHLSNIERPEAFNRSVLGFLEEHRKA
ncbi:MAG: alpha/beta hydrolase [Candidatus Binatus sp.]|uniref:alpha/beta fold hydrolase n=1 Tax=Candidatus Binatus sp. TaxID=2811406 RepID=UPI00271A0BFE|nr:alpha/beta hydrolase [Candidatus Binatus sp.]MDO8434092.1 alpha/beta hydrolase [Candidatus Binatus sp.]